MPEENDKNVSEHEVPMAEDNDQKPPAQTKIAPENTDRNPSEQSNIVLAQFDQPEQAAAALGDLMEAGFLNVEQEVEGKETELVVDPDAHEREAHTIVQEHGGLEIDLPNE
jgi:hypothetical protein